MNEVWKECVPNYEVSSAGRVRRSTDGRRTYAGRMLSPIRMSIGYLSVKPVMDGKNRQFYVHDLVASAFIGPKPDGASVNHIDGNKTNNDVSNLEYVTHRENMRHASMTGLMATGSRLPQSKLTVDSVRRMRSDRDRGDSFSVLANRYGVSIAAAFNACKGNSWSHVK